MIPILDPAYVGIIRGLNDELIGLSDNMMYALGLQHSPCWLDCDYRVVWEILRHGHTHVTKAVAIKCIMFERDWGIEIQPVIYCSVRILTVIFLILLEMDWRESWVELHGFKLERCRSTNEALVVGIRRYQWVSLVALPVFVSTWLNGKLCICLLIYFNVKYCLPTLLILYGCRK